MMKKFFALSLVLGLAVFAQANEVVTPKAPKTEQPTVTTPDQKQQASTSAAENAKADTKQTDAKNQSLNQQKTGNEVKASKTGKVFKAVGDACSSVKACASKGCKAFAALPVSYKVLTGLGVSAAACLVLYNTNEAFRNFIAGSDDDAAN